MGGLASTRQYCCSTCVAVAWWRVWLSCCSSMARYGTLSRATKMALSALTNQGYFPSRTLTLIFGVPFCVMMYHLYNINTSVPYLFLFLVNLLLVAPLHVGMFLYSYNNFSVS